jgi:glutamate-ammonia-ligase adenylyltransferase
MMDVSPHKEKWMKLVAESALSESADAVLSASNFVLQWGVSHPGRAKDLIDSNDVDCVYQQQDLSQRLSDRLASVTDEASLFTQLRLFRQREMVRIIWRDIAGWADLAETVRDLSTLADECIRQSLNLLHQWQSESLGTPFNAEGEEQQLLVIGMGKLGAGELNLSSDIDLIFAYPEDGYTQGGRKQLTNEEYFTRLGRKLIQSLDNVTADGFVFRVDMRLRPFGDSGALVASFDSLENYYQTQGREWERYAMIKARVITGSEKQKQQLVEMLTPFVYRRYLDYGVFESLREMKSMIAAQLRQKGMEDNIKLGAGGIREIEFIGQVFQLIYGGRDKPLQQRPILTILDLLAERQLLSDYAVNDLKVSYDFLRRTEHRIQAWADQQTHMLPKDEEGKARISQAMGFESWNAFFNELNIHRQQVQEHFEQLLTSPQAEDKSKQEGIVLFTDDDESIIGYLTKLGYQDVLACAGKIGKVLHSHNCNNLSKNGRERLEQLLPLLVQAAGSCESPDNCLNRLLPLVESIMRRTVYMSLLVENPLALSQLIRLCNASPWISKQLARYPVLLDELLDVRRLFDVPNKEQQQQHLNLHLSVADENDLERQMYLLREFKQIAALHVAAADVSDSLPLMRVGDQLTDLAELMLEKVFQLAWDYLVEKHGRPDSITGDDINDCGFTILAYGKMGGIELGYGSDLDIVFIYDDERLKGYTDGEKPIDVLMFYTRLVQRMIHIMSTMSAGGILYEVDMRLRPNGASGLVVTPFTGFVDYQHNDAWTWEHQALVRARCVLGDTALTEKMVSVRHEVLAKPRDEHELAQKVTEMRAKMRDQLDKSKDNKFDLKQGRGGITDIEFLVQYAVLAWSNTLPELLVFTDNIRVLDALIATNKLGEQQGSALQDAYRQYRMLANRCVLQEIPALVDDEDVADMRRQVEWVWQQWFADFV